MKADRVKKLLEAFQAQRVAVLGDLMLDRYIWGQAARISQEAPVPIVATQRITAAPGGAANVLRNLATLGARPVAFGVIGDDAQGTELRGLLEALEVGTEGVIPVSGRKTTEKARVLAGNQQIVRVDSEDAEPIPEEVQERVIAVLRQRLEAGGLDAIIVEDYAKGVVTPAMLEAVVELGTQYGIVTALDPHPSNSMKVKGLTLMTPNRPEAFALAGIYHRANTRLPIETDEALREVVEALQRDWDPGHLLITLGGEGMALFHSGGPPVHVPTKAQEVFDVSGAGDTVIAAFVLALASGASPPEAADLANHAAGVVVGKVGTAPVYPAEVVDSFARDAS